MLRDKIKKEIWKDKDIFLSYARIWRTSDSGRVLFDAGCRRRCSLEYNIFARFSLRRKRFSRRPNQSFSRSLEYKGDSWSRRVVFPLFSPFLSSKDVTTRRGDDVELFISGVRTRVPLIWIMGEKRATIHGPSTCAVFKRASRAAQRVPGALV